MKRLFVKMQTDPNAKPVIMELPGEMKVKDIIPNLIQGEGWDDKENGKKINYWFETLNGPVDFNKTLTQAGIRNGMLLIVRKSVGSTSGLSPFPGSSQEIPQNIGPQDVRNPLEVPEKWKELNKISLLIFYIIFVLVEVDMTRPISIRSSWFPGSIITASSRIPIYSLLRIFFL